MIFPGLWLLEQKVQDKKVSHAVAHKEDSLLVGIVHLLHKGTQVVEVFLMIICRDRGVSQSSGQGCPGYTTKLNSC